MNVSKVIYFLNPALKRNVKGLKLILFLQISVERMQGSVGIFLNYLEYILWSIPSFFLTYK